jgi:arsenate reductase
MVQKIYCLSGCSTCNRILSDLKGKTKGFDLQDIKTEPITEAELDEMKARAGSYQALFSRRAQKYKEMNLKNKNLDEQEYKTLILADYHFLKRPVILIGSKIFVGSEKNTLSALRKEFNPKS